MIRLGRLTEARDYLPQDMRYVLDRFVRALQTGRDESRSSSIRANAYWDAAIVARHQGIELMGTELVPDWHLCGGNRWGMGRSGVRVDPSLPYLFPISDAERERLRRFLDEEQPQKQWHYRYVALEHVWACADLMSDNDEELAYRLCIAGGWIKARDPIAADPFYKAIVLRCPDTWLGREADRIHWFPNCDGPD